MSNLLKRVKMLLCLRFLRIGVVVVIASVSSGSLSAQQVLPYGSSGEIVFDDASKTVTVSFDGKTIIADGYAIAGYGANVIESKNYTSHSVTKEAFGDVIGSGTKMTISFTGTDLPELRQVFYAYSDREFFLTEISLIGDALQSNYMAPLVSPNVSLGVSGDARILFVPFDNDTFIRYRSKSLTTKTSNTSAEVTAFYDNQSRNGLVVGSLQQTDWKTGIESTGMGSSLTHLRVWCGYTENSVTRDLIPHGSLTGNTISSAKIFVGFFTDWRTGLDAYGQSNAKLQPRYIFNWQQPTPFIWNSWGVIQNHLTAENAKGNVDFIASQLQGFRNSGTAYMDLDSFWDNLVSGGMNGDFSKLTTFANDCKSKGLKPGIYWAPFTDWWKQPRQIEGSSYDYKDVWTKVNGNYHDLDGGRAMDPTHPGTRERIAFVIGKLKACGFEMIKLDFLAHGAIESDGFYDPTVKTGMQAYRKGMEYIVDQLNGSMLVYVAISPSLASARYCHIRRIACDAFTDIGATEYTLNSTTYGWWQTHLYNYVDGDHVVFANASLGENKARLTSSLITGSLTIGDDYSTTGQWQNRAKSLLQNQDLLDIARNGRAFTPVEGDLTQSASNLFVKKIGDSYYVAVLNYSSDAKSIDVDLTRVGIPADQYIVRDLYTNKTLSVKSGKVAALLGAKDAMILRFTVGIVAGNEASEADTIEIFPNPTTSLVQITDLYPLRSLKIFSQEGKLIHEIKNVGKKEHSVDMTKYDNGLYFITVVNARQQVRTFKIVKK